MPNQESQTLYIILTAALLVLFVIVSFLAANWFNTANKKQDRAIELLQDIQIELAKQDKDIAYLKQLYVALQDRLNIHGKRIGSLEEKIG